MQLKNFTVFKLSVILFFYSFSTPAVFSQLEMGWFQLQSGTTIGLFSVCFVDSLTGWVSGGSGIIRKTTDGGTSWFPQNAITTFTLYSIRFINSMTGWAVGAGGTMRYTTNGGTNWFSRPSGTVYPLYSLQFVNSSTGWIAGYGGMILTTTNGGTNWAFQSTPVFTDLFGLFFQSPQTGWAVGYYGTIIKTTNSGTNWINISIGNTTFNNVRFINSSTGWIVAPSGIIQRSTDGGNLWSAQTSSTTSNLMAIWCTPSGMRIWVGGSGGVIRFTTNMGTNWTSQVSNTTSQLEEFFFLNSSTGWAVGSGGVVIKTYTGGIITGVSEKWKLPSSYLLSQNCPNPFNPKTDIKYEIPKNSYVKLTVFDILGKEVEVLVNEELKPGTYEIKWNAVDYPSGVYFYKIQSPEFTQTKKMLLLK